MAKIRQLNPTYEEVARTKKQLIDSLFDGIPDAEQVVTDLEQFIQAVIAYEVNKRW